MMGKFADHRPATNLRHYGVRRVLQEGSKFFKYPTHFSKGGFAPLRNAHFNHIHLLRVHSSCVPRL